MCILYVVYCVQIVVIVSDRSVTVWVAVFLYINGIKAVSDTAGGGATVLVQAQLKGALFIE